MLIFTRKRYQSFYVGEAKVQILEFNRDWVRVGIIADPSIPVDREEIRLEKIADAEEQNARDLEELRRGKPHTF